MRRDEPAMLILAVDTTTPSGSVALLEKGSLLAEAGVDSAATHSERLLDSIDFVLKLCRRDIQDMDGYALAAGPGSFTGIRIGLSTVKSFAFASGKPVAPVSALEAFGLKLSHGSGRLFCPLMDAKKGELFAALFESCGGKLREVIPQGVYKPDAFFSLLPSHRVVQFIGSGVEGHMEKIIRYLKDKARFSRRSLFIAHEVGMLGYEFLRSGRGLKSHEIEPIYFRKSQAEEKT